MLDPGVSCVVSYHDWHACASTHMVDSRHEVELLLCQAKFSCGMAIMLSGGCHFGPSHCCGGLSDVVCSMWSTAAALAGCVLCHSPLAVDARSQQCTRQDVA